MSGVKSKKPSPAAIVALLISMGTLMAVSVMMFQDPAKPKPKASDTKDLTSDPTKEEPLKEGYVRIGGVQRPKTDVEAAAGKPEDVRVPLDERPLLDSYGQTPFVPADANPQVKSLVEALKDGKSPERFSAMVPPKPFDPAEYNKNPERYLETVEPGRVFSPAQPGPNVPRLDHQGVPGLAVVQGQSVPLQVKAVPDAPVTFTSFDLGRFQESLLTSVTVKADANGIATARFEATPGTIGKVDILAASPVTSGQLRFLVDVTLPKPAGASGAE